MPPVPEDDHVDGSSEGDRPQEEIARPVTTPPHGEGPVGTPQASPAYGSGPAPALGAPGYGPQPHYGGTGWSDPPESTSSGGAHRSGISRVAHSVVVAWLVAGLLALAVVGLSVALATGSSGPAVARPPFGRFGPNPGGPSGAPRGFGGFAGGSGVVGTVATVGSNSFTVNSRRGQTVTVDEQSSTSYFNGSATAAASAVTTGVRVAVQGSRNGNTVTATRVTVLPSGGFGAGPVG